MKAENRKSQIEINKILDEANAVKDLSKPVETKYARCSNCSFVAIETSNRVSRGCVEWVRLTCKIHSQKVESSMVCSQFKRINLIKS